VARLDRARVRLAELVAALSLGVDLGFGQPVEHVLRQCLIALRLAERAGLEEERRAVVYYTALLVNVGCHTDAHEQAKWFGDDVAVKAVKYEHDMRSMRGMAAGMRLLNVMPTQGSANPALTIMALASRLAERLHGKRIGRPAVRVTARTSLSSRVPARRAPGT